MAPPMKRQKREDDAKKITSWAGVDFRKDFCNLWLHQSTIVNSTWYIHGGTVDYMTGTVTKGGVERVSGPNTVLRAIDLSKPHILQDRATSPLSITPEQPRNIPVLNGGALWPSTDGKLYEVTGHIETANLNFTGYRNATENQINIYDTASGAWSQRKIEDQNRQPIVRSWKPLSIAVPSLQKGFLLGGYDQPNEKKIKNLQPSQLAVYDFETDTWARHPQSPWRYNAEGVIVHVPFGQNGLLVALGGVGGKDHSQPIRMDEVFIYDLNRPSGAAPGTWARTQTATPGSKFDDIPVPLQLSCAVAASSPDGSSAQIFMYGGHVIGPDHSDVVAQMWVLSIPSFEWYLVKDSYVMAPERHGARKGMTCDRFGKYMMVFGGQGPRSGQTCETTGAYAFDMSQLEWIKTWNPEVGMNTPYTVPRQIVDGIGGTPEGGARKGPVLGIDDPDLQVLFAPYIEAAASTEPGNSSTGAKIDGAQGNETTTPRPVDSDGSMIISPGAIAGFIIAITALIALTSLSFMIRSRRRWTSGRRIKILGVHVWTLPSKEKPNINRVPGTYAHRAELTETTTRRHFFEVESIPKVWHEIEGSEKRLEMWDETYAKTVAEMPVVMEVLELEGGGGRSSRSSAGMGKRITNWI